jgi:uncharacterized membrane protein
VAEAKPITQSTEEDRILRVWTPILLRTILIAATIVLVIGLFLMATKAPGFYVERFHAVQAGHLHPPERFSQEIARALQGDPHSVMTCGLFILTLVPLARVAFCFLLFTKERDYTYVVFTAYVLIALMAGVMLGKIG